VRYRFRCPKGHETEREYPIGTAPDEVVCPECGATAVRKFEVPAVLYRGSGWSGKGHGTPTMDEHAKMPRPWEFDDLQPGL